MRFAGFTLLILLLTSSIGVAGSYGTYTLYSPKNTTKAYLIDLSGTTYHSWTFSSSKPTGYSTYLLPGGVLLRTVARSGNYFSGGPVCGEVQKVDWNGTILWDFVYSTTEYCTHHDICPMPNGNVLLIAYESKTPSQVSAAGCSQSITMWPDKIVEIQPVGTSGGNVVWEWHAWDHLSQNQYPAKANYVASIIQHPELLNINYKTQKDWLHLNGIDYNEQLDQITFSSHAMNELYVIDHSTTTAEAATHTGGNSGKGGDLIYRWGNPLAYQASGTADFNVVHDAHWIPMNCPRANSLVGFNNLGGPGGKSCVDIISPPYDGYIYSITPGAAFGPSSYTWRYTYNGTPTQDEGNSQQLPNGNTLINISFSGYMYEIDTNQNVVWSKTISGVNTSAFRYTSCYVNSIGYAYATADPVSLCAGNSTQLNAFGSGGSDYSYSWTSNPSGFTSSIQNPVVFPSSTTMYYVTISSGSCSESDSIKVVVNPLPGTPSISLHGDSLISGSSSFNQWYFNGELLPGENQYFIVPMLTGSYQVGIIDDNGCESLLSEPYFYTSLPAIPVKEKLQLFPNPTNGKLYINGIPVLNRNIVINIYSETGKLLSSAVANNPVDISGLPPGIYLAKLLEADLTLLNQKIVLIK
jgi:hypothetical protein